MDHAISAWNPRVALLVGFRCPHVGSPSSRLQPLSVSIIIISIIITSTIIITRPKPAYGWQGLAGVWLRASGAQLGRIGFLS